MSNEALKVYALCHLAREKSNELDALVRSIAEIVGEGCEGRYCGHVSDAVYGWVEGDPYEHLSKRFPALLPDNPFPCAGQEEE